MSCPSSGGESELVTEMTDFGSPRVPKRLASRHVVNPNFVFFCQIVLLVIPITVLYAGLYMMNVSSPVIVLACGAIIFFVLCVFIFFRPFKEEKCPEKSPLRPNCEYSPIKQQAEIEPVLKGRSKLPIPKPERCHKETGEDENQCSPRVKHDSTDTLLSIGTGTLPEVVSHARNVVNGTVTTDGRCDCCRTGCRGPAPRKQIGGVFPEPQFVDWRIKGCYEEEPKALGDVEEVSVGSPRDFTENPNPPERLLIPDVALSHTTASHTRTSYNVSDRRNVFEPLGQTLPSYTSAPESSSVEPNAKTPTRSRSPRGVGLDDLPSIDQPLGNALNTRRSAVSSLPPFKDKTPETTCTSKVCSFSERQSRPQVDAKAYNTFRDWPLRPTPNQSMTTYRGRGYFEDTQAPDSELTTHAKQNIFQGHSGSPKGSGKDPNFQTVQFQLCPSDKTIQKAEQFSTFKQPILIKLFPTSSKDGIFSWEADAVCSTAEKATGSLTFLPTVEKHVQTTAPTMVGAQTSAVFPGRAECCRRNARERWGKASHRDTSRSIVDFVLRPFSRAVGPLAKTNKEDKSKKEDNRKCSNVRKCRRVQKTWKKTPKTVESNERLLKSPCSSPKKQSSNTGSPRRQSPLHPPDLCSIYYSNIHGKLYQPTKSGLLITESSKEEVNLPRMVSPKTDAVAYEMITSRSHHKIVESESNKKQVDGNERKKAKRKSDDELKTASKCAKHDEDGAKNPGNRSPHSNCTKPHNSLNDKLTCVFPPFNLDFSSGPGDEESVPSKQQYNKSVCERRLAKNRQPKERNLKISHQVETKMIRKSSSSYDNVLIEKVTKQKKRTLRKFK